MAAGAEAPTSSEYIVHHLQHLQSVKQGFIIDMSVVNWDTIFWSIAMGLLTLFVLLKAASKAVHFDGIECYEGGVARKVTAKFRAYSSYEESFKDYARMMKDSPRYGQVMASASGNNASAAGFAQGLQRAGYATDPAYADKLTRVINTTLRLQRVMST